MSEDFYALKPLDYDVELGRMLNLVGFELIGTRSRFHEQVTIIRASKYSERWKQKQEIIYSTPTMFNRARIVRCIEDAWNRYDEDGPPECDMSEGGKVLTGQ
ncbi:MAG TPA: hypothetical protein VMW24_25050 [Sedimentisphaerales bacterium]|nr:hypothetical protein [Sedimentisphaerales bacterium]